ncbi:MAG: pyridoxamine 5'-phosphate oxidase family protein [Spirochaetia bacterium]
MDKQLRVLYARVWDELCEGVRLSGHPFHTGVLGTIATDRDGTPAPELCTVVLREANRASGVLLAHTDVRSAKVARIQENPRVGWLSYNPQSRLQVRFRARASIHQDDDRAERRWNVSSLNARRCYLCYPAPGTEADVPVSGLPPRLAHTHPTLVESESGRENFAVVYMTVDEVETVELSADGHRRAVFTVSSGDISYASWMVP